MTVDLGQFRDAWKGERIAGRVDDGRLVRGVQTGDDRERVQEFPRRGVGPVDVEQLVEQSVGGLMWRSARSLAPSATWSAGGW